MNKVHFDPHNDGHAPDKTACGIAPCEEEYLSSSSFNYVTCGRCLKMNKKLANQHTKEESYICEQMGDMADFHNKTGRWKL